MERKLRYCAVCGIGYKFCPKCNEDKDKPLYHFTFCSENCKDIYSVISDYKDGETDKEKSKELLSKLDLSKFNDFRESYKRCIDDIFVSNQENKVLEESICEPEEQKDSENNEIVFKKSKRTKRDVE